ncbi:MAG: MFS transporter, partial [Chloroflexota bacterium]
PSRRGNGRTPRRRMTIAPPFRTPFFYGWVILAVSMAGCFLAAATNQIFMGVMLKPISDDLGWSRTATSGAFTIGTITAGLASALVGPLVDRYGPRIVMPVGAVVSAVLLYALAGIDSVVAFYVFYIAARVISQATLAGVAPTTAMANWFLRRRGRAMGLVNMSLPLGGSVFAFVAPLVMGGIGGWRGVFAWSAVLTLLVAIPGGVLLRRRPEDVGLLPDGGPAAGSTSVGHPQGARAGEPAPAYTLREALRTSALWLIIFSQLIAAIAISTFGFHQSSFYTDQGLDVVVATLSVSMYGLAGALSSTAWGFLSERINERWLAMAAFLAGSAMMAFLVLGPLNEPLAITVSLILGFTGRGQGALFSILLARYYGRNSYGAISGFIAPFQMAGLGLGPILGSAIYDGVGSYKGAFTLYFGFFLAAMALVYLAKAPRRG